ncbi:MAG: radical SAM family heme chaperone HemW [Spirochaetaceae bacterium]|nr:radical SAM family heme chaperone HemW [Spirochaetaceae bacterium]
MTASLYIHIPFCSKKCDYCDFFSIPIAVCTDQIGAKDKEYLLDQFLLKLYQNIEYQLNFFKITNVCSVYIGGGSPSLLGIKHLSALLKFINSITKNKLQEFTIEFNPEFVTEEVLLLCKNSNVTRISIGIQTFNTSSRKKVGRIIDSDKIFNCLQLLRQFYPDNFSADLIAGLPEQDLLGDIKTLLSYKPAHISLYDLSVETNTPLHKKIISGEIVLPAPEETEATWILGRDLLEKFNYMQYEVSNFCLDEKRSSHNTRYWLMQNWIGAGPSASGTIIDDKTGNGKRYTIKSSVNSFLDSQTAETIIEDLDRKTLVKESLLMGFRYIDGPSEDLFKTRFGIDIKSLLPNTINTWVNKNLFSNKKTALTKEGLLFLNTFLRECFTEIEDSNILL